ncbi:response regulator transcription factor [Shewanella dokdonensis]|uniref:Response regulator transcription factor n=1 Tax=Shewanella dokdonensis TaxID=712036 RepID=A0ABX8DKP4_9GAMM|nr:response regulator transcription factor [Shewanella dokdonensis]MCL1075537.1 response regulator transcription factor [Shewanella dokdonensis]QVK24561.1 response regulator transcription factor [Shewanella dokdonensis]
MAQSLIHIIDDDPAVRNALQNLFRSVSLDSVSYALCTDFLDAPKPNLPGCLLLDVRLPGMSGLEFQSQLARLGVYMPVIMITGYGDIPMTVRAMKAGAIDFLSKPFRDQDLLDAVNTAIEQDIARRKDAESYAELTKCYQSLTERERQVMALVTSGYLNKQSASELGISEITIKLHRASLMRKMNAKTLAELVKMSEKLAAKDD